jgi:hypothetical protein
MPDNPVFPQFYGLMFDLSQFSAHILAEAAAAYCADCGEVPDAFDRCGCDY